MAEKTEPKALTKLKIKLGSLELEFYGSETFLRSDVPKLVTAVKNLHASEVSAHADILKREMEEAFSTESELDKAVEELKKALGSISEMSEMESLRLQMAMDRLSKMMSTLSNVLKKINETANSIVQNLK